MATNYLAKVKLSNFIDARMHELEDNDGNMEMCLVIPIEKNALEVDKDKNVYCEMFVNEKTYDSRDGYSYFFKQKTNAKHVAKLDSLGYKTPYLGYMKISKFAPAFQSENKYRFSQRVKNLED